MKKLMEISLLSIVLFFFFSCQEDDASELRPKVEFELSELKTIANERLIFTLNTQVTSESKPVKIKWLFPDSLSGSGPFEISVSEDTNLSVELTDADGNKVIEDFYINIEEYLNDSTYDWRNDYTGKYKFYVKTITYFLTESDEGVYTKYDTTFNEYEGTIKKYLDNRLLIKYSSSAPYKTCGNTGCNTQECMDNCDDSAVIYTKNWINPLLSGSGSVLLFNAMSEQNAFGNFIGSDSLYFEVYSDAHTGYHDYVSGKKVE